MRTPRRSPDAVELGDFQTPPELADEVVSLLQRAGVRPAAVLEPTSGVGNFIAAAARAFAGCRSIVGLEINAAHIAVARARADIERAGGRVDIRHADVFAVDLGALIRALPRPLLVLGNPPWVTNAALGALGSSNLPQKSNARRHRGIDALTGKSNFDLSDWIGCRILDAISGADATMAVLCKSSVARKLLHHCRAKQLLIGDAAMYGIDAKRHFGASVDACLFVCGGAAAQPSTRCAVYADLTAARPERTLAFQGPDLVSDAGAPPGVRELAGRSPLGWRSGIKHDRAKLMELREIGRGRLENGLGAEVDIEPDLLYPMLKSSDVARGRRDGSPRWMLVTQRRIGEDTRAIERTLPRTWAYLTSHREAFAARASSIYRGKPEFSIFGVGDYTFTDWKVAISGLYKSLRFAVVGPIRERPVVFDDTCYLLPCAGEAQARAICALLSTAESLAFYASLVHWGDKRPIKKDTLDRLDLGRLARTSGEASLSASGASGGCSRAEIARELERLAEGDLRGAPFGV